MDNPQYRIALSSLTARYILGFKPYYKWITLNTKEENMKSLGVIGGVLNLIING